jgi:hypothetical protein
MTGAAWTRLLLRFANSGLSFFGVAEFSDRPAHPSDPPEVRGRHTT